MYAAGVSLIIASALIAIIGVLMHTENKQKSQQDIPMQ